MKLAWSISFVQATACEYDCACCGGGPNRAEAYFCCLVSGGECDDRYRAGGRRPNRLDQTHSS